LFSTAGPAPSASTFEFEAVACNAGISGHAYETTINVNGTTAFIGFRNDLELGRNANSGFRLAWHQDNPMVPDLEMSYTHINSDSATALRGSNTWGGVTDLCRRRQRLQSGHAQDGRPDRFLESG